MHSPVSVTSTGYVVLASDGGFIAWCECMLDALLRSRKEPLAQRVERCSDGAVIAVAPYSKLRRTVARAA